MARYREKRGTTKTKRNDDERGSPDDFIQDVRGRNTEGYALAEGNVPAEESAQGGADGPIIMEGSVGAAGKRPGFEFAGEETMLEGMGAAGL